MKKTLLIILLILIGGACVYLAFTRPVSKHYYYPFNAANNLIIKKVYEHGKVSCGQMGYCLQIDTIIQTATSYQIRGGKPLRIVHTNLNVKQTDGGKGFDVTIPNRDLIFRNNQFAQQLMDEITTQLFLTNGPSVYDSLNEIKK